MRVPSQVVRRAIGVDLGKRFVQVCVVVDGNPQLSFKVANTPAAWSKALEGVERRRLVWKSAVRHRGFPGC